MIKISIKKKVGGAALLVRSAEGQFLILKRAPESHFAPNKWGLPGGKIEEGESPLQAAIRETQEETQLIVRDLIPLGLINDAVEAFFTDQYEGSVQIDFEHTAWKWIDAADFAAHDLAPSVREIYEKVKESDY